MTNNDTPLISVIIPFYNSERTLNPCLESLSKQTDTNFEVVMIDDGSNDASLDIARRYTTDHRFKLVILEYNKGQAVARNAGVNASSGLLLAFTDADVEVPPDWLASYRGRMAGAPEVSAMCGGYEIVASDPPPALFASIEARFRRLNLPSLRLSSLTTANCVMRRAAFESVGGFQEYYVCGWSSPAGRKAVAVNEDSELGYLLSTKGHAIEWCPEMNVRHHFRPTWAGYLRQQRIASWAGAVSMFRFPGMLWADDLFAGERIIPQLVGTGLAMASPLLWVLGPVGYAASAILLLTWVLFLALTHRRFFVFVGPTGMGSYCRLAVFGWMLVARVIWVVGVSHGVVDGLRMRLTGGHKKREGGGT